MISSSVKQTASLPEQLFYWREFCQENSIPEDIYLMVIMVFWLPFPIAERESERIERLWKGVILTKGDVWSLLHDESLVLEPGIKDGRHDKLIHIFSMVYEGPDSSQFPQERLEWLCGQCLDAGSYGALDLLTYNSQFLQRKKVKEFLIRMANSEHEKSQEQVRTLIACSLDKYKEKCLFTFISIHEWFPQREEYGKLVYPMSTTLDPMKWCHSKRVVLIKKYWPWLEPFMICATPMKN